MAWCSWALRTFSAYLHRALIHGQLEDLYVKPEYRGTGLGKRLFGELGVIAKEKKCARVEWRVLKVRQISRLIASSLIVVEPAID